MEEGFLKPATARRKDGLTRVHAIRDVFRLVSEIEAFRARPPARTRDVLLEYANRALREALLLPFAGEGFVAAPAMHVTAGYAMAVIERHARPLPRIRVDARVDAGGDLVLECRPESLGDDGLWHAAREWAVGPDGVFSDEAVPAVAFRVRRAGEMLHEVTDPEWGSRSAREDEELSLATQAVVAACRVVVGRLSERFDVTEDGYVVGISQDGLPHEPFLGLEVVRGLEEHRASVGAMPKRLRDETGLDPDELWHACEAGWDTDYDVHMEKVARRLRARGRPGLGINAASVRQWHQGLEMAMRYGLWEASEPTPEQVREAGELVALTEGHLRPKAPRPLASPHADPRYPARAAELPEEVKAEFGVEDGHHLVALVNAERAARGRGPIPQGDFPGNRPRLMSLVKALRDMRA